MADQLVLRAAEPSLGVLEELAVGAGICFSGSCSTTASCLRVGTKESVDGGELDLVFEPTLSAWPDPDDYTGWTKLLTEAVRDESLVIRCYDACTRLHSVADSNGRESFYAPWLNNPSKSIPLMNYLVKRFRNRVLGAASRRGLELKSVPRWPGGKKCAFVLSHDVDRLSMYSWESALLFLKIAITGENKDGRPLSSRRRLINLAKSAAQAAGSLYGKPHNQEWKVDLQEWAAAEQSAGVRSTFFIAPHPRKADRDPAYTADTKFEFGAERLDVGEWARLMSSSGWEVGLHGSLLSATSERRMAEETELIRKMIGDRSVGCRQHLLSYKVGQTGKAHEYAKLLYDSSLGYNELIGFRNAAALPFYPNEPGGCPMSVLQLPLVIHDTALYRLQYDAARAVSACAAVIDKVREAEGCAAILFHPMSNRGADLPETFDIYRKLLSYLSNLDDAWITTGRELSQWWCHRSLLCRGLTL